MGLSANPSTPRAGALATRVGPLCLRNPVLAASGTWGYGLEARLFTDPARLGGIVVKSVTRRPRAGNPPPRIVETAAGMLNSIGIMNPGLDRFVAEILPELATLGTTRIVNIAGETQEDFAGMAARLDAEPAVDAIELNVSCPNVSGGLDFGVSPPLLQGLVAGVRKVTTKPLIVKLTPNVTDIAETARAAEEGGADILSLVNTFVGLAVDWRRRTPRLGSPTGGGGLSGPAIKPLALHAVRRVRGAVRVPIIGIGGIATADDVLEFIVTGASAVQIGTMNFVRPGAADRILEDLESLAARGEIGDIGSMVGTLRAAGGGGR